MTPAGWYPNPDGTPTLRYWNGQSWTPHSAPLEPAGNAPMVGYAAAMAPPQNNSLATASLVLGIVGAIFEWGGVLTLTVGVLALIFGAVGLSRAPSLGNRGRGKAIAGLILGCFAIFAYVVWGLLTFGILWII